MNMIDAFYQSLICFFIPYFVSLIRMFWAFAETSIQNPWLFKYVFLDGTFIIHFLKFECIAEMFEKTFK